MKEIYISTDVESDGPIPGPYSMLNFGSVAMTIDKEILGTFSINLQELPEAGQHSDTMKFWAKFPEIWEEIHKNQREPKEAMDEYLEWLNEMSKYGKLVFVAYPAGFDFTYIRWYLEYFCGECPFGFQALDIKSYAMAVLKTDFKETVKKKFRKSWFEKGLPHTHLGLDDAIEQGHLFINMLLENKST